MMERDVRDVLRALAGCVAMRCAAEKNLEDIANMERLQRTVWEMEFSSSADPAQVLLLPGAEVSRRRARAQSRRSTSTAAKHSGSGIDRGDGSGNDNNAKGIGNGTGTPTYSGEYCYTTDPSSKENHHHHHSHHQLQQHRVSSLQYGSGGQKLVRVHSLGSAKFLFDSALDHRKSGIAARTRSNGSENSAGGGGEGLQYSSMASDVWATRNLNASSVINNNNNGGSGQNSRGRWGRENTMLKTWFSPFKLPEGANELRGSVEMANSSASPAAAFASTDTPRYSPTPASHRDTLDGGRRKVSPTIGKKTLCGSTWLGPEVSPEVSPVPHDQDPRLTRAINFEASSWSGPTTMKLRRGPKGIGCRGEGKRGNGIGMEGELEPERGMRCQRGRRGDQQRVASISKTGNTSSGKQAVGMQALQGELKGREGGESRFSSIMSSKVGRKRNHTGDSSTAGHSDSEEHGGATWDCSDRANGQSSPSLRQEEEACPDRMCSSSCLPLAQGDKTHPGEWQGDLLMEKIISETSPKVPSYHGEEGGGERRPDVRVEPMREMHCSKQDHISAESPDTDGDAGSAEAPETDQGIDNASLRCEISRENEAEFGAEWSSGAYYQSPHAGEDNDAAGVDDDGQTETTTSDEDDDGTTGRSDPLIFSKSMLSRPRDDVVDGDDGGTNKATDDTSTTSRSSAAEGTPRVLGPSFKNIGGHNLRDGAESEVLRPTEIEGGDAFAPARGLETSAASSTTMAPFRCCTPDVEKSISVGRDSMGGGRQQQPESIQDSKHQQQHHRHQRHRLLVESPKYPLGQRQHNHQHQRQRRRQYQQTHSLWQQPQRRGSANDQVDRSRCKFMQEKLTALLTKRLKQLAQLEALTIQWERLPRREQEKLDRQQRLLTSRFRLAEQVRCDSGVSLSTVPPVSGPAMTATAINHSPTARAATGVSVSHRTTPSTGGNGRIDASDILPPSDASISRSVDLPSAGAHDGVDTTARAYFASDGASGEQLRDKSFAVSGRVAARHPRISNTGGVTLRGQRRWREEFGRGERGCRGGGACGVQDADTASGRARRWRLGSPSLRIVGVKTSIDDKLHR